MYRRVLLLLLTAVLLLSGCTAGQKNMPQKTDEKEMTGQPSDMSGEGSMYMNTTENVIYLAGGCFWGIHDLIDGVFLIRADPEQQVHLQRLHKIRFQPCALIRFVLRV